MIKTLSLNISKFSEEQIFLLEENLLNMDTEFYFEIIENKECIIFNNSFKENINISFKDYIIPGKILKTFLLENNIITDTTDNSLFSMKTIEDVITESITNGEIYQVPPNDEKLLDVLNQLNKIKTK